MLNNIDRNERGFTVVELVVVMAVLGTFVLLAAPKFLQVIEVADKTHIQNDIRVAEDLSVVHIYENDFKVPGQEIVNESIVAAIEEGRVYDLRGLTNDVERISQNTYFKLDETFVREELRSNLDGEFVVTENADVLYVETTNKKAGTIKAIANNISEKVENLIARNAEETELDEAEEMAEILEMNTAEELLEDYTSLLSSIK